nr:Chain C, Protein Nef [Human immunodeficiency virus 1]
NYTPGPGTRF